MQGHIVQAERRSDPFIKARGAKTRNGPSAETRA